MEFEKVSLSGGRRANIEHSDFMENWWTGYGKDSSCQFEGTWEDMVSLAEKILAHPNTKLIKKSK